MDVSIRPVATIYFACIIILGAFFQVNLILAVIIEAFKDIEEKERELEA
jgi:hypothetical protein